NGPLALCMLGDGHPYIMFKMLTPDVPQATEEFMTQLGIEIGAPHMPFANEFQRLVWEDDSPEVIHREFTAMTVKLERVGNEGSSTAEAVQSNDPADHR